MIPKACSLLITFSSDPCEYKVPYRKVDSGWYPLLSSSLSVVKNETGLEDVSGKVKNLLPPE